MATSWLHTIGHRAGTRKSNIYYIIAAAFLVISALFFASTTEVPSRVYDKVKTQ